MWWFLYRRLKTAYVLSLPFSLYGVAFFLIGLAPLGSSVAGRGWIQNVATGFYAVASSSGSIYFAVNFGDEGMPSPLLPSSTGSYREQMLMDDFQAAHQ